ncbi:flagellar protein FlaG [Thermodesulfobacteriota bacterium]
MDVNMNAEVKGYGTPAPTTVERDDKVKAESRPVEPSNDTSKADERRLSERKAEEQRVTEQDLAKAAEELQSRLDEMGTGLQFSVDDKTESIVIKVTQRESGEVVRQIPAEEILDLKAKLENLIGVLFDKEV